LESFLDRRRIPRYTHANSLKKQEMEDFQWICSIEMFGENNTNSL
jgi:hypothetical protein